MATNSKKSDNILITDIWYSYCSKFDINWFNAFKMVYNQLMKESETELDLYDLGRKLDKFGVYTNKTICKLYGCLYYFYQNTTEGIQKKLITGFFDVTDFLQQNYIHNDDELQFLLVVVKQFIDCGGIVRINKKDFFEGDDKELEKEITTWIWNIVTKNNNNN